MCIHAAPLHCTAVKTRAVQGQEDPLGFLPPWGAWRVWKHGPSAFQSNSQNCQHCFPLVNHGLLYLFPKWHKEESFFISHEARNLQPSSSLTHASTLSADLSMGFCSARWIIPRHDPMRVRFSSHEPFKLCFKDGMSKEKEQNEGDHAWQIYGIYSQ